MNTSRLPHRPLPGPLARTLLAAAGLLVLAHAQAANYTDAVYKGAQDEVRSIYQAERQGCQSQTGNARDVCLETANGQEKVALAMLAFNHSGQPADQARVYQAQTEARYDIAVERCDDLSGNPKDICVQAAKTERDRTQANLKLARDVKSAADTAVAERQAADYKLAKQKCDTLAGDAQDVCVASAKARYSER